MAEAETIDKQEDTSEFNTEDDDLPQKILEKYSSDLQVQLIKGYRILQVLMYYLNNTPFFDKPENVRHAGKLYYDVIKNPMWFNEIKRKIFNAEYNSLVEVIKDMRLVFENCYYFWGPKTSISEQCVKMERLMEKQLVSLPKDLKNLCSLEETHGKNEDEVVTKIWNRYRNKGKSISNLMLRTWRKRRLFESEEYVAKSNLGNFCDCKQEIQNWENDVLRLTEHSNSITTLVQLPQIGLFFHVVQNALHMEPYCQLEIERMFLMPQHSASFLKISTSLLIDVPSEDSVHYENLMTKMKNLVSQWYSIYEEKNNEDVQASEEIGIEADFFRVAGESNPLLKDAYEDLMFDKKVVILKALCDYLVRSRSEMKEAVRNADEKKFCAQTIGRDKLGYVYLFFNTFSDFRLYKQKLVEDGISSDTAHMEDVENERKHTLKKFFPLCSSNFEMVAQSVEELRCLVDELIYCDVETSKKDAKSTNYEIIESLRELESQIIDSEDKFIELTNNVRVKMFTEWKSSYSKNNLDIVNDDCGVSNDDQASLLDGDQFSEDTIVDTKKDSDDNGGKSPCLDGKNSADTVFHHAVNDDEQFNHETDIDDFLVKTEIKDEPHTDDSLSSENAATGTRRRRSSVPSYNVFDKKLFFSDESDSESPEEIYTEGDDSDDDWNVPKKKSKKSKNKLTKQLKLHALEAVSKKRRNAKKNENSITTEEETVMKTDQVIKDEPDDGCKDVEENQQKNEKSKSALKIKVVDLAKLKKAENTDVLSGGIIEAAPLPRIVSQGTLRVSQEALVNAVPVLNNSMVSTPANVNAFSNVSPAYTFVGQPQVISNAYIITTNQSNFQATPANPYQVQQFSPSTYRTQGISSTRSPHNSNQASSIINANGRYINPSMPNNKLVFINQNTPIRFSSPVPSKQIMRTTPTITNKSQRFLPNQMTNVNRHTSVTTKRNFIPNNVASKLGRNITVIPKTNERKNSFKEIEGTIGIHSNSGSLQYVVNLANGTHVPLTNEQVQKLRDGNNGALPLKLKIPVPSDVAEKIEPCVVIDD